MDRRSDRAIQTGAETRDDGAEGTRLDVDLFGEVAALPEPVHEVRPRIANKGKKCFAPGCIRHAEIKGLCRLHYGRMRTKGDIGEGLPPDQERPKFCFVEGCHRPYYGNGCCIMHYQREKARSEHGQMNLPMFDPEAEAATAGEPAAEETNQEP